ncbi:hypothetical protein DXT99_25165 [Pontibacter diazotrophicus]|uniref:Uncharacterized protein n=1 Tax=Pontibacter diazotrophicus TaxID=1400979 RepID=A0A3D8L162_9BACT|nr:hypothetical protein [Pontibacter diazotrophicus]RDV11106.1 hypothetical protein DXT99_25165 [Pontibacter diazotrophicus]
MKATFQTKEGQLICKAHTLDYTTRQRAVKVAISKGAQTLQSTDERGRVQDLTHILQSRVLFIRHSL